MDLTQIGTAVTVVKTLADLFATYKQPVLDKLKESDIFRGNDIIALNLLADNPDDQKTQDKLEGIIETRIGDDAGFEDRLKDLLAELQKPETIAGFKFSLQTGSRNENDQSGGEGSKVNRQYGDDNKNKQ